MKRTLLALLVPIVSIIIIHIQAIQMIKGPRSTHVQYSEYDCGLR